MLREALKLQADTPINQSTLDKIDSLLFYIGKEDKAIKSLEDITKLTNLTKVTICDNTSNVSLTHLKSLKKLQKVTLKNGTYDLTQLPI